TGEAARRASDYVGRAIGPAGRRVVGALGAGDARRTHGERPGHLAPSRRSAANGRRTTLAFAARLDRRGRDRILRGHWRVGDGGRARRAYADGGSIVRSANAHSAVARLARAAVFRAWRRGAGQAVRRRGMGALRRGGVDQRIASW